MNLDRLGKILGLCFKPSTETEIYRRSQMSKDTIQRYLPEILAHGFMVRVSSKYILTEEGQKLYELIEKKPAEKRCPLCGNTLLRGRRG